MTAENQARSPHTGPTEAGGPPPPGREADADGGPDRAAMTLVMLIAVASVANLNLSVANVALPEIGRHFDASQIELNLVAVGFSLGLAGSVLWLGAVGDRYGRRALLLLGTTLALPTSLAAAWAPSIEVLTAVRVLGGVAAGMAFPTTLALITALWRGSARTRSIALWSGVGGSMAALGPLVAGLVLSEWWWGSVFLVTVPLAVVAIIGAWRLIPAHVNETTAPVDNLGGVLSVVMVGAAVLAINFAPEPGMITTSLVLFLVGVVATALFVIRQRRAREPLYDLTIAARRMFWVAAVAGILVFGSLMGAIYIGQQYLQEVLGYSTLAAGAGALPAAAALVLVAPHSASMVDRFGSRVVLLVGYLFSGAGFVVMWRLWDDDTTYPIVAVGFTLLAVGVGLAGTPASRALTGSVPVRRAGMASGTADLQRDLGGAIMQSILGAILTAGYAGSLRADVAASPQATEVSDQVVAQLTKSIAGAEAVASRYPQYATEIVTAARASFVDGQQWAFLAGILAMAVGTILVWFAFPRHADERRLLDEYAEEDSA